MLAWKVAGYYGLDRYLLPCSGCRGTRRRRSPGRSRDLPLDDPRRSELAVTTRRHDHAADVNDVGGAFLRNLVDQPVRAWWGTRFDPKGPSPCRERQLATCPPHREILGRVSADR